jgi:hypothetical protein
MFTLEKLDKEMVRIRTMPSRPSKHLEVFFYVKPPKNYFDEGENSTTLTTF